GGESDQVPRPGDIAEVPPGGGKPPATTEVPAEVTATPEGRGFSLEKVQRRALAPPNEHIWKIKGPNGEDVGTIDTTWNPDTGNLHIEDFQSEGGPNTLGQAAIRQLRSALLEQYPGVQSLSGLRISGATYAHKPSGAGPGREATQVVRDPRAAE